MNVERITFSSNNDKLIICIVQLWIGKKKMQSVLLRNNYFWCPVRKMKKSEMIEICDLASLVGIYVPPKKF